MMGTEVTAIAVGLLGGAVAGGGLSLWRSIRRADEKCEFLDEFRFDLASSFEGADALLSSEKTPKPLRLMLLFLLQAHSEDDRGKRFAKKVFIESHDASDVQDEDDTLTAAIRRLGETEPALARLAHRTLNGLLMGLFVVHYGDGIVATRVQRQLASDPVSIWSKLANTLGFGGHNGHNGGVATA